MSCMGKTYCFISAQFYPTRGGVERYTQNLGRELIKQGNRVIVITSLRKGLAEHEDIEGIEVWRVPSLQLLGGRFPVPISIQALKKIRNWLSSQKIDFLVIQTHFYVLALWGAIVGKKLELPRIGIDHCTGYMMQKGITVLIGKVYENVCVGILNKSGLEYYGVSGACCDWMKALGLKTKGILFNAVDPENIHKLIKQREIDWRARLGLDEQSKLILYAGRLVEEKGIRLLLESFRMISSAYSDVVLIVMGDGPLYQELSAKPEGRVFFLGSRPHEDVISMLSQTDIFCLPTYYPEGLPTTVLEAAAAGAFIITTKAGGSKELIDNGDKGIILDCTDIKTLTKALKYALDSPEQRERAAQNAAREVGKRFTWQAVCKELVQIEEDKKVEED